MKLLRIFINTNDQCKLYSLSAFNSRFGYSFNSVEEAESITNNPVFQFNVSIFDTEEDELQDSDESSELPF